MSFQKLYFCYKHYEKCPNTLQNRVPVVFTLRNRCLFDVKYNRYIATNHKHTFQTLHRNGMIYLYTIHTYSHTHLYIQYSEWVSREFVPHQRLPLVPLKAWRFTLIDWYWLVPREYFNQKYTVCLFNCRQMYHIPAQVHKYTCCMNAVSIFTQQLFRMKSIYALIWNKAALLT